MIDWKFLTIQYFVLMLLLYFIVKLTQKGIENKNNFYFLPGTLVLFLFVLVVSFIFKIYPGFLLLIVPFILINFIYFLIYKKINFLSLVISSYIALLIFFQIIAYLEATQVFH